MKLRLGDSIIHVAPTARDVSHRQSSLQFIYLVVIQPFLSKPLIDNAPNENGGVGVYAGFRERNKSKEIQPHSFTLYNPSRHDTFDKVPDVQKMYTSTLTKHIRKFERTRHKRASSVLSTYSDQLRFVMEKLPVNRIVPPIRGAGAAVALT